MIWISDRQAERSNVNSTFIIRGLRVFSAVLRLMFAGVYLPRKWVLLLMFVTYMEQIIVI